MEGASGPGVAGVGGDFARMCYLVITKCHIDIAGWTDVRADMTADTLHIVRGDVTPHGFTVFFNPVYRILWTVNDTVVAFETHTATHAAAGLLDGLLFAQASAAFFKIPENLL